jgi:hypothetical protein
MVKRSLLVVPLLAMLLGGAAIAKQSASGVTIPLEPQHGSKIGGKATIVHGISPNTAIVTITLDGVFIPETQYPAGIYRGACAMITPRLKPMYELTPVQGGRSTTNLKARTPIPGKYAIAVWDPKMTKTMSCGGGPLDAGTTGAMK